MAWQLRALAVVVLLEHPCTIDGAVDVGVNDVGLGSLERSMIGWSYKASKHAL